MIVMIIIVAASISIVVLFVMRRDTFADAHWRRSSSPALATDADRHLWLRPNTHARDILSYAQPTTVEPCRTWQRNRRWCSSQKRRKHVRVSTGVHGTGACEKTIVWRKRTLGWRSFRSTKSEGKDLPLGRMAKACVKWMFFTDTGARARRRVQLPKVCNLWCLWTPGTQHIVVYSVFLRSGTNNIVVYNGLGAQINHIQ